MMPSLSRRNQVVSPKANEGAVAVVDPQREHSGESGAAVTLARKCNGRNLARRTVQRAREGAGQVALIGARVVWLVERATSRQSKRVFNYADLVRQGSTRAAVALAEGLDVGAGPVHQIAASWLRALTACAAVTDRNDVTATVALRLPSAARNDARSTRRLPSASLGLAPFGA